MTPTGGLVKERNFALTLHQVAVSVRVVGPYKPLLGQRMPRTNR